MLKRIADGVRSNPFCDREVQELVEEDFRYYDKDGFELNFAEQKFYSMMGYPIWHGILNHHCWQEPWFELNDPSKKLILEHSMILHRCCYTGAALNQLKTIQQTIPLADCLIKTKAKWGFDFALDAVAEDGTVFEVIHIEYDSTDYKDFTNRLICTEYDIKHKDWHDAAEQIWSKRDQWKNLKGFDQNHWKAGYLLGWKRAEYVEKTI